MKKAACMLLSLIMTAALAACGSGKEKENAPGSQAAPSGTEAKTDAKQPEPLALAEIVDGDGKRLGKIDADSACTAVDGGIFYSVTDRKENAFTYTAWYRFFRAADGKDVLLGTLEGQGYEAFYARTELDGVIYTLAIRGNAVDYDPDTLLLLAFDPAAETMETYEISKFGFPYAAMAAANGKLLIMNHEMSEPKRDTVYEFDPAAKTVREILSFPDDGKTSLRSIAAAEDGFYLLRLGLAGGLPEEFFLDRYDGAGKLQGSVSLNKAVIPAMKDQPGFEGEDDVLIEFGTYASGFAVQEGRYLFYENFGRVRVIVDLETGEALFADEDLWSMVKGSGKQGFFELAFEPYETGRGPEILVLEDGKTRELSFRPDDGFFLQAASCSADGTWLLRMANEAREYLLYLLQEK